MEEQGRLNPGEERKKKKKNTGETEPRRRKEKKEKEGKNRGDRTQEKKGKKKKRKKKRKKCGWYCLWVPHVCLITKMSLSYELWKLKTAKMCFQFP